MASFQKGEVDDATIVYLAGAGAGESIAILSETEICVCLRSWKRTQRQRFGNWAVLRFGKYRSALPTALSFEYIPLGLQTLGRWDNRLEQARFLENWDHHGSGSASPYEPKIIGTPK